MKQETLDDIFNEISLKKEELRKLEEAYELLKESVNSVITPATTNNFRSSILEFLSTQPSEVPFNKILNFVSRNQLLGKNKTPDQIKNSLRGNLVRLMDEKKVISLKLINSYEPNRYYQLSPWGTKSNLDKNNLEISKGTTLKSGSSRVVPEKFNKLLNNE